MSRRPLAALALAAALGAAAPAPPAAAPHPAPAASPAATAAPMAAMPRSPGTGSAGPTAAEPDDLHAARVETARHYRDRLRALLALQEAAAVRAAADAERRRALHAQDLIAAADVQAAERALAAARARADATGASLREADALLVEAEAARELARLPAPMPGQTQEAPALLRHQGRARWSLAAVPALARFFETRFGQPLPISAYGQTSLHDRLGFDHRNALDVALHPDSPEGRVLLAHLRERGFPFLAFRTARPGAATGPHVHVGAPSVRLSALPPPGRPVHEPGAPASAAAVRTAAGR